MPEDTGNVQALVLDSNHLDQEFKMYGYEEQFIAKWQQQYLWKPVKLRAIPDNLKDLITGYFSGTRGKSTILSSCDTKNKSCDLLVIAPEQSYLSFCDQLSTQSGLQQASLLSDLIKKALKRSNNQHINKVLQLGSRSLPLGKRTLIMGILNVTPDSFSDGGHFNNLENALKQAYRMAKEGADIIDVGGESTRPGHERISAEEELKRVLPVIEALKKEQSFKIPLSIDTYKATVARQALELGVEMLNDVWGFKEDSELARVAAEYGTPVCLMHNKQTTDYADLMSDIIMELEISIAIAHQAGVDNKNIIIDPGIGFGKDLKQNLEVMLRLRELCSLGYPLLLGTSRKSMIGKTLNLPANDRLEGTAATVAYGISVGADIIRIHDVKEMRRVAEMTDAMVRR